MLHRSKNKTINPRYMRGLFFSFTFFSLDFYTSKREVHVNFACSTHKRNTQASLCGSSINLWSIKRPCCVHF